MNTAKEGLVKGSKTRRQWGRALATVVVLGSLAGVTAAEAFGHGTSTPATIVGNAPAGKGLFVSTCGACHTLSAAGTAGTLGPNLTTAAVPLTEQTIIAAITNGGATVMTQAAVSQYQTQMVGYGGSLSTSQIDDIAAYVYTSTHAAAPVTAKPSISSFTPASGKAGTKLTVTGTNLTGATAVKIGALKTTFKVVSATKITLTVPTKAKSGKIGVTTGGGTATSSKSFTIT